MSSVIATALTRRMNSFGTSQLNRGLFIEVSLMLLTNIGIAENRHRRSRSACFRAGVSQRPANEGMEPTTRWGLVLKPIQSAGSTGHLSFY